MELILPNESDKEVVSLRRQRSQSFQRMSNAARERMTAYWADKRHHRRVDKKQAKKVDVYDLNGKYIRTYPSARKAAEGLFPDAKRVTAERCIRRARSNDDRLLSYKGFMYRTHDGKPHDIEPLPPRKHKPKGYHVNRRPDTYRQQQKARYGDL